MDALVLIGSFTVLCLIGMPVAYALGLAAILAALWMGIPLEAIALKTSDGMDDFPLLAIPFFILAGAIMGEGGMASRIIDLAKVFVGFIRGGLALVNIVASTMFGCISGSSVADTASIGSVMIPQMIKAGYPRLFAVNVTISGSLQPLLIPPSHNMVIYSLAAGGTVSVAHLFIGGVIPGLLLGASLMVLVLIYAYRNNLPKGEPIPLQQALRIALDSIWGLVTVVIIMGGILSGIFTPTESAAVACVWAFFVTMFIYRSYKWSELPLLIGRVVRTVGMVMIMIGFSVAFGYMMALMRIPALASEFFSDRRRRQVHVPALRQPAAAVARHVHGSRADAADLHAGVPAGDRQVRHRPGAFRHHHDLQPRDRPVDAPGRSDARGRLRHRQGDHGSRLAQHHGVLHPDADRAGSRHLHPGADAVAAAAVARQVAPEGAIAARSPGTPPAAYCGCVVCARCRR